LTDSLRRGRRGRGSPLGIGAIKREHRPVPVGRGKKNVTVPGKEKKITAVYLCSSMRGEKTALIYLSIAVDGG